MNRNAVNTLTGMSCLVNDGVTGDLLTSVILESRFEGYLSDRHNWICWKREKKIEKYVLRNKVFQGSRINNDIKMYMPCRKGERE